MTTILIDGFDKYGPGGIVAPSADVELAMGRWTSLTAYGQPVIIPGLIGIGSAVQMPGVPSDQYAGLSITLPQNYSRLIGGFRFTSNLGGYIGCAFLDNFTYQSTITIQPTSGFVSAQTGRDTTNLGISPSSVAGNTVHYLEFDVTFNLGAFGGYTVWLDGVQVLEGTGNTITTVNPYANVFQFFVGGFNAGLGATGQFDDFYLFDDTTAFNNSVLLSNPAIITQVPIGDHQTQFSNSGNAFGNIYVGNSYVTARYNAPANTMYLIPFTPNISSIVDAVGVYTAFTGGANATANFKGLVYADNSGLPGALLSDGVQVTGCTSAEQLILPLATPAGLTAGVQYWLGFRSDSSIYLQFFDGSGGTPGTLSGYKANATYSSGAPNPAPSMTSNQATLCVFGLGTGATANWASEALNPPIGDYSSVTSAITSTEDLYIFPAVPVTVVAVYTVCVSGNARLTYPGTHTIDLIADSGGTSSPGSNTDIPPTLNYAWYDSYFDVDPNTSAAWTPTAVSNGFYGMSIAT